MTDPDRELICLVTPSGYPNYGDEFILRTWLRHLAVTRSDADVVVDCYTPGQAAVLHRGEHPRVMFVDTIWRICNEYAPLPSPGACEAARRVVHDPGVLCRIASGIELLARADVIHFVGGGYVNDVWPHHVSLFAAAAAAVERSRGRLMATGQGLAPVAGEDRHGLIRDLIRRFDVFDVRDAPSLDIAGRGPAVSYAGDDAWLGVCEDGVYDPAGEATARSVVLCLQGDLMDDFAGGEGLDGLVRVVTELLGAWRIDGRDVAVVEGIPGIDRTVFDRITHRLPGAFFVPFVRVWRHGLPARAGQMWVSTRFHFHLLAAAAGASGLALPGRRDYYPVKHASLIEAGSNWRIGTTGDLPAHLVKDGGFARTTVDRLHAGKESLAARLYPASR